jgi:phosphatidylglycerol:prolipoprotein diacylglycerol transferase
MRPILFQLGGLPVYTFGFLVAAGVLLSLFWMSRRAKRTGFPPGDMAFDMVFAAVASGFLGARLYYVIQNAGWYAEHPLQILAFWEGGLIFYGGMAGAFFGLWVFTKFKKVSFFKALDFILPYVALTQAFGRLGCFMNGCCYGKVCDLPWAVKFQGMTQAVHPAQLYESGLDFLLFIFLNRRYDKEHFDGQIALLYFLGYTGVRFIVEGFRENPALGIFTINQWISLAVFAAAAGFYAYTSTTHRRPKH